MIKKLRSIYIATLVIALPASLYILVYATNIGSSEVASATVTAPVATALSVTDSKPITIAKAEVKKPVVKKAPVKKKVVAKKKKKKKERLIPVPAIITAETAPHTGR